MQTALEEQFTANPWPDNSAGGVVFILDARNRFEQNLLEQWIERHSSENPDQPHAEKLIVSLNDDRKGIDSSALQDQLDTSENAIIAPLRIAWTPSQESIDSGPSIRNLLFGDPRRPSARRGRKILHEHPDRLHLISGQPDSRVNLLQRFKHQQVQDDGN